MSKETEHLKWIWSRLFTVYKEPKTIDYMVAFENVIKHVEKLEKDHEELKDFLGEISNDLNNTRTKIDCKIHPFSGMAKSTEKK